MAAKQLGFFFLWLLLHNNVTPSALSHCTEKPASLSFSPQFFCFFSFPRLSLFYWGSQILFARSKWLCVQRQRERRNAWETDRDAGGVGEFFFFFVGGGRVEMSCSDVTSAAGWQDGKRKLACATQLKTGRIGRHRNGEEIIFLLKHTCNCKTCTSWWRWQQTAVTTKYKESWKLYLCAAYVDSTPGMVY